MILLRKLGGAISVLIEPLPAAGRPLGFAFSDLFISTDCNGGYSG
jgi:hypothetical protein